MLTEQEVDALRKQIQALQLQQKQLEALLESQQCTNLAPSTLRDYSPFAERPNVGGATPAAPCATVSQINASDGPCKPSHVPPLADAPPSSFPVADSLPSHVPPLDDVPLSSFPVADSQGQVQPPPILRAVPRSTVRPDVLVPGPPLCSPVVWPHHEPLQTESSSQESSLKEGSKLVAKGLRGTMKSAVKLWFTLSDKADELSR